MRMKFLILTQLNILKRPISFKSIGTWYSNLVNRKPEAPPYKHIIQIGDPVLRTVADEVPIDMIASHEIQCLINHMKKVFRPYNCVGLAASQLGIPFRILLIEFSKAHFKEHSPEEQILKDMTSLPMTVVINPTIKITDYKKITFAESCHSVKGFNADVPRYYSLELKGYDENAKSMSLLARGWNSRIIQHELDHLDGKLYTDIMDRKTLSSCCWEVVNQRRGKVELPYGPQ